MDLRQLRYFSTVYEHRKLSHAAQAANVAQSAISHHLLNLELELGVRLFDRLPRGMQPTASGTRLYEHAQAILRSVAAATASHSIMKTRPARQSSASVQPRKVATPLPPEKRSHTGKT